MRINRPLWSCHCQWTSIAQEVSSKVQSWRNNLFCTATTVPLLYLAVDDIILVYEREDVFVRDTLVPARTLQNPLTEPTARRAYGAQPGPFDSKAINVVRTFRLDDLEIVVTGDGLGRVILRDVNTLDDKPICFNLGSSVWGVDIQGRKLAVSCNSHEVYLFDLEIASMEATPIAQLGQCLTLRGASSNIPCVCISGDKTTVACIDITCQVTIWNLCGASPASALGSIRWPDEYLPFHRWESGWACSYVHPNSFRTISGAKRDLGSHPEDISNPVRSLQPKLDWWNSVGADVYPELHPTAGPPGFSMREVMLCLSFAQQGLSADPEFESHWQKERLSDFTSFVPTYSSVSSSDLLLITTVDMVALLHPHNIDAAHAICYYPFGSKWTTGDSFERINMVKVLQDLGLVAIATQKGQVCILELVKCFEMNVNEELCSYSFRCHSLHPDPGASSSTSNEELLGMDFLQIAPDSAELLMLFRNGRIHVVQFSIDDASKFNDIFI